MRFACLLAALAASLSVLADDPPKDDGQEAQKVSEKNFFDFQREWRVTCAHMAEGLTRTYSFESKSADLAVTGTVEIVTQVPEPDVIIFEKKVKLDNAEELKGKRVELPPMLAGKIWAEPPPMQWPEKAVATLEKDVEVKVGEKTLKCWKLTLTTDENAPLPNLNISYWFSDEGRVGLVRATVSSGTGKSMVMQLTSWKDGEK